MRLFPRRRTQEAIREWKWEEFSWRTRERRQMVRSSVFVYLESDLLMVNSINRWQGEEENWMCEVKVWERKRKRERGKVLQLSPSLASRIEGRWCVRCTHAEAESDGLTRPLESSSVDAAAHFASELDSSKTTFICSITWRSWNNLFHCSSVNTRVDLNHVKISHFASRCAISSSHWSDLCHLLHLFNSQQWTSCQFVKTLSRKVIKCSTWWCMWCQNFSLFFALVSVSSVKFSSLFFLRFSS